MTDNMILFICITGPLTHQGGTFQAAEFCVHFMLMKRITACEDGLLPVPQTLLFSLLVQQQEAGLSGSNLHADAASHTGGAPSTTALAPHFQDTSALCPGCAVHHEGTKLLQASAWQGLGSSRAPPGSRKASAHLLFTLNEFLPSSAPLPKAHSVGSCEQISNSLVKTVSPYNERCQTLPTKKSIRLNFQQLDKSAAQLYLLHLK